MLKACTSCSECRALFDAWPAALSGRRVEWGRQKETNEDQETGQRPRVCFERPAKYTTRVRRAGRAFAQRLAGVLVLESGGLSQAGREGLLRFREAERQRVKRGMRWRVILMTAITREGAYSSNVVAWYCMYVRMYVKVRSRKEGCPSNQISSNKSSMTTGHRSCGPIK